MCHLSDARAAPSAPSRPEHRSGGRWSWPRTSLLGEARRDVDVARTAAFESWRERRREERLDPFLLSQFFLHLNAEFVDFFKFLIYIEPREYYTEYLSTGRCTSQLGFTACELHSGVL